MTPDGVDFSFLFFLGKGFMVMMQDAMERGWFMTEDSVKKSEVTPDLLAVYATAHDIARAMAYIHSKDIIHGDLQGDALGLVTNPQDPRGFIAKVTSLPLPPSCAATMTVCPQHNMSRSVMSQRLNKEQCQWLAPLVSSHHVDTHTHHRAAFGYRGSRYDS